MLKKVAIEKKEIYRLIRMDKYKEALDYLMAVRETINKLAMEKVDKYLENELILEKEKRTFLNVVENDINNKLLENENYILVDEKYINNIQEKVLRLKSLRRRV